MIWARNAPENLDAQRAAAVQLARAGRYEESMEFMEKVLQGQGDTHFDFLALSAAETNPDTRTGLLNRLDQLLAKDRTSAVQGKRGSVRVDIGGRSLIKKKTKIIK